MKIQCDVCEKREAAVFCAADEAALCETCDNRVHHANKLASKHQRFSLHQPTCKEAPKCDICQERRAVLFCTEDRAILCRECDIPIHISNEHTQKHNRFLLTGVKLSASSSPYPTTSTSSNSSNYKSKPTISSDAMSFQNCHDISMSRGYGANACGNSKMFDNNYIDLMTSNTITTPTYCQTSEEGSISTSDYMTDTAEGWRLEDLIDASSAGSQFYYF